MPTSAAAIAIPFHQYFRETSVTTLLIDLDDTLLVNDINTFLPSYLRAFSLEVSNHLDPKKFLNALMAGTDAMVHNKRPDCTLKQAFDQKFFPLLGLEERELQGLFNRFYEEVFPTLQGLTGKAPGAVQLVQEAVRRGWRIAVATNPLFPRTAIHQRLQWAGFSPVEDYFDLVASYETFHFTKPNLAFFAEALARLAWPDGPVIMIGDSIKNDIRPARAFGLPAFWVQPDGAAHPPEPFGAFAVRTIQDVLPWIDQLPAEALQPDFQGPDCMMATLLATPAALQSMTMNLAEVQWMQKPQAKEWSLTEIICHLRDVDIEVNLPRLKKVVLEDNPFLPGMDTDPWSEQRMYNDQDGHQALADFTHARMKLHSLLTDLQREQWSRSARHAIFGRTHGEQIGRAHV